jgi:hypothetical protein
MSYSEELYENFINGYWKAQEERLERLSKETAYDLSPLSYERRSFDYLKTPSSVKRHRQLVLKEFLDNRRRIQRKFDKRFYYERTISRQKEKYSKFYFTTDADTNTNVSIKTDKNKKELGLVDGIAYEMTSDVPSVMNSGPITSHLTFIFLLSMSLMLLIV